MVSWTTAGSFSGISDPYPPGTADEWVFYAGKSPTANMFALKVVGDSMAPEFQEGDIVIVDPSRDYRSGDYVIAKIPHQKSAGDNGEATLKKLVFDGPKTYLVPVNPRYDAINMTGINFIVVGVVVQKVKDY